MSDEITKQGDPADYGLIWYHCPICKRLTKHAAMPPFEDGAPCARCAVCGCPHDAPWPLEVTP